MDPGFSSYETALLAAAAASGVLAYFVWRNRPAPGAGSFALLMLAVTEWSLGYVMELGSAHLAAKALWANIQYPAIVSVPVLWLVFSLHYAGLDKWLPRYRLCLLSVIPVVTLLLAWSNESHHLLWTNLRLERTNSFIALAKTSGIWFWVHSAYSYLLVTVGTLVLTRTFLRMPRAPGSRGRALVSGVLAPWAANLVYIFRLSSLPYPDPTPFVFAVSSLAMAFGVLRYRLLGILPVARTAAMESMRDGVIVLDPLDRIVDVNPAAEGILGCVAQNVIGRSVSQVFSECFGSTQRWQGEAVNDSEIILGEGEDRWCFRLQIGPIHKRDGSLAGRLVVFSDVTESRRSEERLRAAHDQLELRVQGRTAELARANQALQTELSERERVEQVLRTRDWAIRSSISAMALADLEGSLTYVNPAFRQLWGHDSHEELLGRSVTAFWQDQSKAVEVVRALSSKGHWIGTLVAKRRDGTTFEVELAASMVTDEAGRPICMMASFNDITERKRLEEQLRQAAKMEAIGQLAGGIAHDFNNLLTVINGYGGLLLASLPPDDPARQYLAEIRAAGSRAAALTKQLLAFGRRDDQSMEVVSLNDVLTGMAKMLRPVISEEIKLELVLAKDLGNVRVDRGQIEQVVMNLAVNARDAMPTGGTLILETRNAKASEEYLLQRRNHEPSRYVVLVVSDNGCGMTPEVQERIFEPFFTTKAPGKGTGLGLSTVYAIVKQSGGAIDVRSHPGQGTAFRIFLPRVEGRAAAAHRDVHLAPLPQGQETILVVEDDDNVRGLASTMLRHMGYAVLEAVSGPHALSLLRERPEPINLALLDVVMPQMSGHELAQRLLEQHDRLEVLYMSGYTDSTIAKHGVLRPGVNFMQKPFTMDTLARKVRQALDGNGEEGSRDRSYRSSRQGSMVARR